MAQIAIVGVGAIGSVVGAALIDSRRHAVTLCAHRLSFNKLIVRTRDGVREVPASPIISEKDARPVEWVLLCTKAHQTVSAAGWLRALSPAKIAVLQNGVEHVARVAPIAQWRGDCAGYRAMPGAASRAWRSQSARSREPRGPG